jgi:predicted RNase H-like HicB family nuclease
LTADTTSSIIRLPASPVETPTQPRKYRVDIYWSEEDECYLAEVPDLPGCLTHGETVAEAAQNAEEAMEGWLEAAEQVGARPSAVEHYEGGLWARIPDDLCSSLTLEARRQDVPLHQLVVARLAEGLGATAEPRAPRRRAKAAEAPVKAT